jgi:hypothetical protein
MTRHHVCPGEDCPTCAQRIGDREFGDPDEPDDWQQGQDAYEAHLDRLGGST